MMLRMVPMFGLRRKEQLRGSPWEMDGGTVLIVSNNMGKGGRDRVIPIDHPLRRVVLDYAKSICKRGEPMGWPGRTFAQNQDRYKYILRMKLKITLSDADCVGHGLRAEFVENQAMQLGLLPPSLGGTAKQMSPERRLQIEQMIALNVGHNRVNVLGAYYGSFRLKPKNERLEERIAGVSIGDGSGDIAGIFISPPIKPDESGAYPKLSEAKKSQINISIVREVVGRVGASGSKQDVADFLKQHPQLEASIAGILDQVGL